MSSERKATVKRNIDPVIITVKVKATKVNENGTFSGLEVLEVNGPTDSMGVACPPMGGGSMYLKTETLEGLKVHQEGEKSAAPEKKKLF